MSGIHSLRSFKACVGPARSPSLKFAALPRSAFLARRFSAKPTSDAPKTKPTASTPLRRDARASLPIRANPTPTRGAIEQVVTISTAERYSLGALRSRLPHRAQVLQECWWVPNWGKDGQGDGEVFVFANGSVVCWGGTEGECEAAARSFVDNVIRSRPREVEIGLLKEEETEELEFVNDPKEDTRLQGDLIILGKSAPKWTPSELPDNLLDVPTSPTLATSTLLARYAFSHALARSTALAALESSLDAYLVSVASLPRSLERTGRPGLGRKAVIRKLGEVLRYRQTLMLSRESFTDTPDFYWAEPELESYFNSMNDALEVRARTAAVNEKITYSAEVQSTLRQLLTESSSHRMELIIIALIAVEVVLAMIREGPELWHRLTGRPLPKSHASNSVEASDAAALE